LKTEK